YRRLPGVSRGGRGGILHAHRPYPASGVDARRPMGAAGAAQRAVSRARDLGIRLCPQVACSFRWGTCSSSSRSACASTLSPGVAACPLILLPLAAQAVIAAAPISTTHVVGSPAPAHR